MSAEEEARAAAYRARIQGFERQRLARENALKGSPSEMAQLETDWEPLLKWEGWDPIQLVREPGEEAGGRVGKVGVN